VSSGDEGQNGDPGHKKSGPMSSVSVGLGSGVTSDLASKLYVVVVPDTRWIINNRNQVGDERKKHVGSINGKYRLKS
jgi:hypothetical protein